MSRIWRAGRNALTSAYDRFYSASVCKTKKLYFLHLSFFLFFFFFFFIYHPITWFLLNLYFVSFAMFFLWQILSNFGSIFNALLPSPKIVHTHAPLLQGGCYRFYWIVLWKFCWLLLLLIPGGATNYGASRSCSDSHGSTTAECWTID